MYCMMYGIPIYEGDVVYPTKVGLIEGYLVV